LDHIWNGSEINVFTVNVHVYENTIYIIY